MSPDTVAAIEKALTPVAEKIGQGAQYGWEIVVRQQYISGITGLISAGLMFVGAGILAYLIRKAWLFGEKDNWRNAFPVMVMVFGNFALIVLIVGFVYNLTDGIQHLLNPDYYALDFFIHLGSSSKN